MRGERRWVCAGCSSEWCLLRGCNWLVKCWEVLLRSLCVCVCGVGRGELALTHTHRPFHHPPFAINTSLHFKALWNPNLEQSLFLLQICKHFFFSFLPPLPVLHFLFFPPSVCWCWWWRRREGVIYKKNKNKFLLAWSEKFSPLGESEFAHSVEMRCVITWSGGVEGGSASRSGFVTIMNCEVFQAFEFRLWAAAEKYFGSGHLPTPKRFKVYFFSPSSPPLESCPLWSWSTLTCYFLLPKAVATVLLPWARNCGMVSLFGAVCVTKRYCRQLESFTQTKNIVLLLKRAAS